MALSIPFRQQLPRETARTLDSLVPNIKKDILGSISTRNISDIVDWTDVPFVAGNFAVSPLSAGGTWDVTTTGASQSRYMVMARLMLFMVSVTTSVITGFPRLLRLGLPDGFTVDAGPKNAYTAPGGFGYWFNFVGPSVPRTVSIVATASRGATSVDISDSNTALDFGYVGDAGLQLQCMFFIPLQEWR